MSFWNYVKRLFVIHKCAACGEILGFKDYDEALCSACRLAFDVAKTESCPDCQKAAFECSCQPKLLSKSGSLCLKKLYFYYPDKRNEPQNRLIYHIKHHRSGRATDFVARELWQVLSKELYTLGLDKPQEQCIVSNMPRGRRAVLKNGFDQSKEICKQFEKISGIPYKALTARRRSGKEQKKLTARRRRDNIKSLMYTVKGAELIAHGKYVILLDDVVTTGASMSACVNIVRKMGTIGIICCALSYDLKNKRGR